MKKFQYTITDELGIHARPAGMIVKAANGYKSSIAIEKDGKSVDARRLMAIMSLGVKQGMTVTITIEGEDEASAAAAMEQFFKENL
ncbi:HPr family phosphocarrier protein [Anaeromicropila populeti]|uniref:Phosphocarrier protein n=1 Tax=Anaeromicropila populeti TaxID=37658 RepID=A0A1I6KS82_9FIRM|nr:HPr family phosphocarrier protein [Anaeromicropila populeti]SFR94089.1 phosphocarrier protein [Anaeromicropila populeti]